MKYLSIIILVIIAASCTHLTPKDQEGDHIIAFYNVENLFDTINDPLINDEEFLPKSKVYWNSKRYRNKLNKLSQVISSIDSNELPMILGLCEVENKDVLLDLIKQKKLEKAKYRIIHNDSPDERGIDVALLYRDGFFNPLTTESIEVEFPFDLKDKTRDILYVKGMIARDTIHVFVNHWHSRGGGREKSEPKRIYTAELLKQKTDSIFENNGQANIIITGDFNDNPDNLSLFDELQARKPKRIRKERLYNLSYINFEKGEGSIYWKSWDMFDQFIVSSNLLKAKNGIRILPAEQFIFKPDWILFKPKEGPARPNRTKGKNYYGGYSDHLPVYIRVSTSSKDK